MLKMAHAAVQGRGHKLKNSPCQDKTYTLTKNGVSVIALADGAGSCKHSDVGATIVVETVCKVIAARFDIIYNTPTISREYLVNYIQLALYRKAEEISAKFKDLSATFLFAAVKGEQFLAGHIGDGVIGCLATDGRLEVISKPENGEFANETYFVTSSQAIFRFRGYRGTINQKKGFILMSDGAGDSLYDVQNAALAEANRGIIEWVATQTDEIKASKALKENLEKVIVPRTNDDCSIAVMTII